MKTGKIILLALGLLVLGAVAAIITGPEHTHVERSVIIDAPMKMVMNHANTFEQMERWSPWAELDTNQITKIEGEDGTVGSKYYWEGNDDVGKGEQTITEVSDTKVVTDLYFIEPWEGHSTATFTVEQVEEGTKATWAFDSPNNWFSKLMNVFMSMDDMLGPDFEKGVNKLKVLVDESKSQTTFNGLEVLTEDFAERTYVGVRQTIGWEEMEAFFGNSFGKTYGALAATGIQPQGAPSGVFFTWDEENQQADLMAGTPVATGSVMDGFDAETIGGGKALVVNYYGDYNGTGAAHEAIEAYIKFHSADVGHVAIEEYITDPGTEPDTSKWLTRIVYPLN